jgi:hypothetical protein
MSGTLMEFKNFLTEERYADVNGFTINGNLINLHIRKGKFNDLMEIKADGARMLTKLKSAETIKSEYNEEDWPTIEKIWEKTSNKRAKEAEKILAKFENELNKLVIEMEKDFSKF